MARPMTIQQAREIRRQIGELRNRREARVTVRHPPQYDPEADRLWNESMRLCRVLEDAGHPTWVEGEHE